MARAAGWGLFPPELVPIALCGGGAKPPFSLGNAAGNAAPTPGLGWDFLKSDERLGTSPEGAEPVDAVEETEAVRRCAGGGV